MDHITRSLQPKPSYERYTKVYIGSRKGKISDFTSLFIFHGSFSREKSTAKPTTSFQAITSESYTNDGINGGSKRYEAGVRTEPRIESFGAVCELHMSGELYIWL